jgi:hypothetical protein
MLKLNRIPEDRARAGLARARTFLDELAEESDAQSPRARQSRYESMGRLSLEAGLLGYALEEPALVVRRHLAEAAGSLARALVLRETPEPAARRNPWQAEQYLNVVACFGDPAERAIVSGLSPWQYRHPEHREHDPLASYLALLCRHLGGEPLDADVLRHVVEACGVASASKETRLFLLPLAEGLLALEGGDDEAWNRSIARLVAAHAREARSGELKLRAESCICLGGLLLAGLGLKRGRVCRAESPYLPLFLLRLDESR